MRILSKKDLRHLVLGHLPDGQQPYGESENGIIDVCFARDRCSPDPRAIAVHNSSLTDKLLASFIDASRSSRALYDISVDLFGVELNKRTVASYLQKYLYGIHALDCLHVNDTVRFQIRVVGSGLSIRRGLVDRHANDGFFFELPRLVRVASGRDLDPEMRPLHRFWMRKKQVPDKW